ncbi:hypothetical protein [Ammoniphilus sp. 3BR4]|uniref:hypothetical protein n=1 Tax=Ammoniphilus sp. 3BR4 TaxID=3158265 RepID=UPI003466D1BC
MSNRALSEETVGNILEKDSFPDLYDCVWNEGKHYFSRSDSSGRVDIVIVFQDIEDFSQSSGSQVMLDFQVYKGQFFIVVWTLTDPQNPLGFPVGFKMNDQQEEEQLQQIFQQEQLWIHYLAMEEQLLIHIFSEAYQLPPDEREACLKRIKDLPAPQSREEGDEAIRTKEAHQLTDEQLLEDGIGYMIDYSSSVGKYGEEQAEERLMSSLLQALTLIKNHPNPAVRTSSFLIWIREKREHTHQGQEARLVTIFMSPPLNHLLDLVNDQQVEENPLSSVILSMPEFLMTVEANPLQEGAYPLIQVEEGAMIHLELDESLQEKLSKLYTGGEENPYTLT